MVLRVGKNTKHAVLCTNLAFLTYYISCLDPCESARKLKLELLEHLSFSPDLAPLGVHMSGLFKDALRGRHCASDQPVKKAVHAWLVSQIFYIIPIECLSVFCIVLRGHIDY
jgi:hypothetical protein